MITAKEASELYNGNLLLRDKYIEEVVEPLIKENAPMSKAVSLQCEEFICVSLVLIFQVSTDSIISI